MDKAVGCREKRGFLCPESAVFDRTPDIGGLNYWIGRLSLTLTARATEPNAAQRSFPSGILSHIRVATAEFFPPGF